MDHRYFEPRSTNTGQHRRHALGMAAAVLLAGLFGLNSLRNGAQPTSVQEQKAPELIGTAGAWLNTGDHALHLYGAGGLAATGHVVLIDFWDDTSAGCLRALPHLQAWDKTYRRDGLVIVGIYSPRPGFAGDARTVRRAAERLGITYPVLIDSGGQNGKAWSNNACPRQILVDTTGNIREDRSGEGSDPAAEEAIRAALLRVHPGLRFGSLTGSEDAR